MFPKINSCIFFSLKCFLFFLCLFVLKFISSHFVPLWWNKLPASARAAESIKDFKKQQKAHLFYIHLTNPEKSTFWRFALLQSWFLGLQQQVLKQLCCNMILLKLQGGALAPSLPTVNTEPKGLNKSTCAKNITN